MTILRGEKTKYINYHYDFTRHQLRDLIDSYLLDDAEDITAGSINHLCTCLRLLKEFFDNTGYEDLGPEAVLKFMRWLTAEKTSSGRARFSEAVIGVQLNCIVRLYEVGLCRGRLGWNQHDFDLIRDAVTRWQRGLAQRLSQRAVETALSVETFTALAKVVLLEMKECEQVLRERDAGKRASLYNLGTKYTGLIDPNPFVAFSLEAGLRYGLRSQELNSLRPEDLRVDGSGGHHYLYVHAPDKEDDFIPIEEDFLRSLDVCREWSREAREIVGASGEGLCNDALLVYLSDHKNSRERLSPLTTYSLNRTFLPYFYKKWFGRKVKDRRGKESPLLHAEGDPSRPLDVSFIKIRHAFAARFIEREPNRAVAQRVMRHKSIKTTERQYLHRTTLTHARKVHVALESEAQLMVSRLKNPIESGVSRATLRRAKEAGAVTPHGICASALEGQTCRMASDCLVCPHLIILTSRKPRFEADLDEYTKKAGELLAVGDHRGAENSLSRAKLCKAHINRIEDMKRNDGTA